MVGYGWWRWPGRPQVLSDMAKEHGSKLPVATILADCFSTRLHPGKIVKMNKTHFPNKKVWLHLNADAPGQSFSKLHLNSIMCCWGFFEMQVTFPWRWAIKYSLCVYVITVAASSLWVITLSLPLKLSWNSFISKCIHLGAAKTARKIVGGGVIRHCSRERKEGHLQVNLPCKLFKSINT